MRRNTGQNPETFLKHTFQSQNLGIRQFRKCPETTRAVLDEPIDTDPAGDFRIGLSTYDAVGFIGLIDEVRIYDRALSDAEILSVAGGTTPIDKLF